MKVIQHVRSQSVTVLAVRAIIDPLSRVHSNFRTFQSGSNI